MKKVVLHFYGYTWEEYAFQISSLKGIFIVYRGQLDPEGFIDLKEILYVGYHHGIIELYDNKIIDSLKQYMVLGERLFLSYAEEPNDVDGKQIASLIAEAVQPKHREDALDTSEIHEMTVLCQGNCKLIPKEIK